MNCNKIDSIRRRWFVIDSKPNEQNCRKVDLVIISKSFQTKFSSWQGSLEPIRKPFAVGVGRGCPVRLADGAGRSFQIGVFSKVFS